MAKATTKKLLSSSKTFSYNGAKAKKLSIVWFVNI